MSNTETPNEQAATDATTDHDRPIELPDKPIDDTADEKPGSEAAKYRRRLRDTEAERDTLTARVETMQKREVERLVATDLATPADLWLTDTTMADLVDDNGDIDPAKVGEAVTALLAERPGWRRTTAASFDGGARTSASTGVTFQQVLQGGRRR